VFIVLKGYGYAQKSIVQKGYGYGKYDMAIAE
jgi:hypothetical protein